VTGAGSGIGRPTGTRLAAAGMQVCVVDLNAVRWSVTPPASLTRSSRPSARRWRPPGPVGSSIPTRRHCQGTSPRSLARTTSSTSPTSDRRRSDDPGHARAQAGEVPLVDQAPGCVRWRWRLVHLERGLAARRVLDPVSAPGHQILDLLRELLLDRFGLEHIGEEPTCSVNVSHAELHLETAVQQRHAHRPLASRS
jgi:hypothetical protein